MAADSERGDKTRADALEAIFDEHYCDEWDGKNPSYTSAESLRQAIAKACKKARVQKAPEGWTWHVEYTYCAKKDHADLDSLTHSAQDAVSKDYLHCVDKEFYGTYKRAPAIAPSAAHEETHLVFRLYPKARSVHLWADKR